MSPWIKCSNFGLHKILGDINIARFECTHRQWIQIINNNKQAIILLSEQNWSDGWN